ncbi:hypothetical protein ACIRVK_03755 [Streptomyces sp. NPDC101152]|uniref:hypothetical protein n=1 Tax=Streptomyces sp. NPDC101152 TaxID=3366116 RepID=UPI0037FACC27
MSGAGYWSKAIAKADAISPKAGALKRLDRFRGAVAKLDPAMQLRAWNELKAAVQAITERYAR